MALTPAAEAPVETSTPGSLLRLGGRLSAGWVGLVMLLLIALPCLVSLPWSIRNYDVQRLDDQHALIPPSLSEPMGTDLLGRSMLWRCLLGGAISLGIGLASAVIAVVIGVAWGSVSGYMGGRIDGAMMRIVDVLYGLPYILLVVLIDLALQPSIERIAGGLVRADLAAGLAQVTTLLIAIGGVSWLTMARVIRGQTLSLKSRAFVESAHASGAGTGWVLCRHVLPNLIGPIVVYTTLTVPAAVLQESFLSFLGIGVRPPLPSWGNLAAEGLTELHALGQTGGRFRWWLLVWPCVLLGVTLLGLNLAGDALRDRWDPRSVSGGS